jgi:uncharacterized membrane protein YraQ (UPF0718 family)
MLAAPALNPAVLVVTFLIFPASAAWTRLGASIVLVLLCTAMLGRAFRDPRAPEACPIEADAPSWRGLTRGFGGSLRTVAWNSLPAILIGVLVSAAISGLFPMHALANAGGGASAVIAIVLVAVVAAPLALPTFGEIPIAVALLAAGAPAGAAVAVMIAGPAVNLPSLLTLARSTSWRVAAATAAVVVGAAIASGTLFHAVGG